MNFEKFKIKNAEAMLNNQVIEHDINAIYAYMLKYDVENILILLKINT